MTIDLRYLIPVAALFAPSALIVVFAALWGVEITDRAQAAFSSGFLGVTLACFAAAAFQTLEPIRVTLWVRK